MSGFSCGPIWRTMALFVLTSSLAQAAGQHALTHYGEPPKYPANFQHFDYVNPAAPKGGTFRQAGLGSYDSLNPFISKGVSADGIGIIYDTLTHHSKDEPFTEYGLLAGKIEVAPDHTWVRFYLRPEARFNDGQAVTAADVVFSFETLMKDGEPQYKAYYADVAKVSAEDRLRVRFDFKHGNNRELPLILGQLAVLPKHWWANRDFTKGNLDIPLGSGPYKVGKLEPGRSIRYERVKDWWGKDLAVNRGFYNFDNLVIDYYRDGSVTLEALKAGQFDYGLEVSAKNWATAYNTPAVDDGRLIKEQITNHNPTGMQGFIFNIRKPIFQDRRVREALALLFDFEWANKQLFNGAYTRTQSYFENSDLAANGLPTSAELKLLEPLRNKLEPRVFSEAFSTPRSDASGIIREQQRRAYQLLQEAGWRIVDDQMVDAAGTPVKFEFLLAQIDFERVLLPFKRNLADLGITLEIRRVDVSQYVTRLRSRDYDMLVGGFAQSTSPGNEQREYWHSSSADKPGSRNYIGLNDPAIDKLVEGLINADSRQSLITHSKALDRALQWGFYVIPNWHIKTWRVAYWNRFEHPQVTPLYDLGLHTWWAKPEAISATQPASPEQ